MRRCPFRIPIVLVRCELMNLGYLSTDQGSGIVTAAMYAYYLYKATNKDTYCKILYNKNHDVWEYAIESIYILVARKKQYRQCWSYVTFLPILEKWAKRDKTQFYAWIYICILYCPSYTLLYIKAKQYFNKPYFRGLNKDKLRDF